MAEFVFKLQSLCKLNTHTHTQPCPPLPNQASPAYCVSEKEIEVHSSAKQIPTGFSPSSVLI